MRIKEEIKRFGEFWKPDDPDNNYSGVITIIDGGNIELEIFGSWIKIGEDSDYIDLVNGYVEKGGFVTLKKCLVKNIKEVGGISHSFLSVNSVYFGSEFKGINDIRFNEIKFSVEGIDDWVGLSGIKIKLNLKKLSSEIQYSNVDNILYKLDNGMDLSIVFEPTFPSFPANKKAAIEQKIYFILFSADTKSFEEFTSIIHKINYFLCFALDDIVTIDKVIGYSNEIKQMILEEEIKTPVEIYYPSLPDTLTKFNKHPHYFLFGYKNILDEFQVIINNWINSFENVNEMFYLYFSSIGGAHKYLDSKFLALLQGLEMYHRRTSDMKYMSDDEYNSIKDRIIDSVPQKHLNWIKGKLQYANEISLRNRLKDIFMKIEFNPKDKNKFINKIVDTRNYFTHYDQTLENKAAKGLELFNLYTRVIKIHKILLLKILGLSQEKVKYIRTKIL